MMVRDSLVRNGYVFLNEYMVGKSTRDFVRHLAEQESLESISEVHRLTPIKRAESTPNTYSGQYGCCEFPLHTDLAHWARPPRYILLRCVRGDPQVSTNLLDGKKIVNTLGARVLERALVKPRRRLNGKFRLMRILQSSPLSLLRWDNTFIVPASPAGEFGVAAMHKELKNVSWDKITLEKASDTLLIDNWRMLHGRSDVPDGSDDRIVERVYLGERAWY